MIEVGTPVKHRMSGVSGFVDSRVEYLPGYVWLGVQPKAKADAVEQPRLLWADECEWAIRKSVASLERPPKPSVPATRWELGEELEDLVTGYRGIAWARKEDFNHCVIYTLQGKGSQPDKLVPSDGYQVFSEHLRKVSRGLLGRVLSRESGASPERTPRGI